MASLSRSDLDFVLQQILIGEQHAAGADLLALLPDVFAPFGLRTVEGTFNNLVPGQGNVPTTLQEKTESVYDYEGKTKVPPQKAPPTAGKSAPKSKTPPKQR